MSRGRQIQITKQVVYKFKYNNSIQQMSILQPSKQSKKVQKQQEINIEQTQKILQQANSDRGYITLPNGTHYFHNGNGYIQVHEDQNYKQLHKLHSEMEVQHVKVLTRKQKIKAKLRAKFGSCLGKNKQNRIRRGNSSSSSQSRDYSGRFARDIRNIGHVK